MKHFFPTVMALVLTLMTAVLPCAQTARGQQVAATQMTMPAPGVEELFRLDLLPAFKRSVKIGMVSSYDPTGGNDDGFSGKHSLVRREEGGIVIADLKGPGVIYRIWTPTPTDDIVEFYFDGEATPRIKVPFRDIFSGKKFPFLAPASGFGAGGFYSYLPLAYQTSCKVFVRAERINFYQINFATYGPEAPVRTYDAAQTDEINRHLERARQIFALPGGDISSFVAQRRARISASAFNGLLAPRRPLTIFRTNKPGRIISLKLGPARAFAGKARDIALRVYWDDDARPAIDVPVSDFFGYSWGDPAVKSLLLGTADDMNYIYLPMPFDRAARVELVSERSDNAPVEVRAEVKVADAPRRSDEGKLYAVWRRENPTVEGRPYTFVETRGGRGHAVGFILQAQGAQPGAIPEFFEGDDETTLDGELVIRGTGSEDFFNGGWYDVPGRWESRVSLPLSGSLDFKRHLGRTGGYRFLVADAYPFKQSIRSTIEHGPTGNKFLADYTSVVFLYSDTRPDGAGAALPPLAARRVSDPASVVFTPGWNTPIHAFSWSNASLSKQSEKIGGEELRYLSLKAEGREVFGPHYLSFIAEMPAAGRYKVSIEAVAGPSQGIVQLFRQEAPVGSAADLYSAEKRKSALIEMGIVEMKEGDNHLFFKVVGKHAQSAGHGFDIYRVICERVG